MHVTVFIVVKQSMVVCTIWNSQKQLLLSHIIYTSSFLDRCLMHFHCLLPVVGGSKAKLVLLLLLTACLCRFCRSK